MKDKTEAMALFFFEQCAGSYSGHMANVPNNPTLHGLIRANFGKSDITHKEFAELLREFANALDSNPITKEG